MVRVIELHSLKGRVVLYFNHLNYLEKGGGEMLCGMGTLWQRRGLQSKPSGADLLLYFKSVKCPS